MSAGLEDILYCTQHTGIESLELALYAPFSNRIRLINIHTHN